MRFGMKKGHGRLGIMLPCLLIFLCICFYAVIKRAEPMFSAQCSNYSNTAFTDLVNSCVADMATEETFCGITEIRENSKGSVTAIETDTARVNYIKSRLLINIQNALNSDYPAYVGIPLGSVIGPKLFTYYGPELKIKIVPISVVNGELTESFEAAGINQVRHTIGLKIYVDMQYIGYAMNETERIETTVPISESVIAGDVPQYYGGAAMHSF